MIRTNYDTEADVMYIVFGPAGSASDGTREVAPGVFVEYDVAGHPIGVEITSVRWRSDHGAALCPTATAAE